MSSTWIQTISGRTVDLACIGVTKLEIGDIAYSLSQIRRFTGHALRPLSVAEHSLTVCTILQRQFDVTDPAALLASLMHDAHEALTGDVSAPMKSLLGKAWQAEEDRIQRAVLARFGLRTAFKTYGGWIHDADMYALSAEREQLMFDNGDTWPCQVTHPAPAWVRYGPAAAFSEDDWRQLFLQRFNELHAQIQARQAAIPQHPAA